MRDKTRFSCLSVAVALVLLCGCGGTSAKSNSSAGGGGTTDPTSITGTVVDGTTHQPLTGVAVVALEQKDKNGIDRIVMSAMANASGQFTLHPVPPGSYDLVANASIGSGKQYSANVTTGVQPGTQLSSVPLLPSPSDTGVAPSAANISGMVTTASPGGGANAAVTITAMQQVGSVLTTIPLPLQAGPSVSVTTAAGSACPAGSNCATYMILVPGQNPNVGMFSAMGTTYAQTPGDPSYVIDAKAFLSGTSNPDCNPSDLEVNTLDGGGSLTVAPGGIATASTIQFTGCQ